MIAPSPEWQAAYPGAAAGVLVMHNVANPANHPELDRRKAELENDIRARFGQSDRAALSALPSIQPYLAYYARFKKTYHVLLQLESVALKGKALPRVAALVECMFMAELKNQLLTAGHDLDALQGSIRLDVAQGDERYIMFNGQEQTLKPADMFIADDEGIISCVIYGPDRRSCITESTRRVLFTVYAPPGIDPQAVHDHLHDIQHNILLIAPQAEVVSLHVHRAG
jgi:DNA/RNA-binding domain of Phe-tRNA-synthetase-like protein